MTTTDLDPLMTKKEVAEFLAQYFRQSARHIMERTMFLPDFPAPVVLPTTSGDDPRNHRWLQSDIKEWIGGLRRAA